MHKAAREPIFDDSGISQKVDEKRQIMEENRMVKNLPNLYNTGGMPFFRTAAYPVVALWLWPA